MSLVTIVICTRNRASQLKGTLHAISDVKTQAHLRFELLIIDNASTDDTPSLVRDTRIGNTNVRHHREPRQGKGYAYNTGIANARGEVLIFIDDDVRPTMNWLEGMTRPIIEGRSDGVQGAIHIPPHLRRPWMQRFHLELLASTEFVTVEVPYFVGANMAFGRHVLDSVRAFDPALGPGALGFGEESLFSSQMKEAGMRIAFAPKAGVEHHFDAARLSRAAFRDRAYRDGRSRAYVAYHWLHEDYEDVEQKLRAIKQALLRHHLRHPAGLLGFGVMDEAEFWLYIMLGFWEQTLIEQRRPRRYAKRGLRLLEPSAIGSDSGAVNRMTVGAIAEQSHG